MFELIKFYRSPKQYVAQCHDYTALITQARDQAMLGSIYYQLQRHGLTVPASVHRHLISGKVFADKHHLACFNELNELCTDLASCNLQLILVKGAAYKLRGLQVSKGRTFSDIDILVAKDQFDKAVLTLKNCGFVEQTLSEYDRNYYLNWSHQYPPLFHYFRGTGIDLHHGIIPVTSKTKIVTTDYVATAYPLEGLPYCLPSDAYLFIHASVHLFLQEEFHKLAKDLCELNELGRELQQNPSWVAELWHAAAQSGTTHTVYTALHVLQKLFQQHWSLNTLAAFSGQKPTSYKLRWHTQVLTRLLQPSKTPVYYLAAVSWYCRGHLHKMGWVRLLTHSLTKLWLNRQQQKVLTKEQGQMDQLSKPKDAGLLD